MNKRNDLNFEDFKIILNAEKEKIEKNIALLREEADILALNDEVNDTGDTAELHIDNMKDKKLIAHLITEIEEIDAALQRIKDGTYGICEKTGGKISIDRLKAYPAAKASVDI